MFPRTWISLSENGYTFLNLYLYVLPSMMLLVLYFGTIGAWGLKIPEYILIAGEAGLEPEVDHVLAHVPDHHDMALGSGAVTADHQWAESHCLDPDHIQLVRNVPSIFIDLYLTFFMILLQRCIPTSFAQNVRKNLYQEQLLLLKIVITEILILV